MVRAADGQAELKNVRNFKLGSSPVRQILPEERRKGFLALDDSGSVGIFHSTAHRTLLKEQVADGAALAAMSPRATSAAGVGAGAAALRHRQPAPGDFLERAVGQGLVRELSGPDYVWQSTSANSDFEQAEPCAAGLRHAQGSLLRHAAGGPAGHLRGVLYRLLHGAVAAPQGQAGDRADGGAADGDSRLLRRPVPRAVPGEPPAGHLRPAAADAGGHPLRRLDLEPPAAKRAPGDPGRLGSGAADPGDPAGGLRLAGDQRAPGELVLRR